MGKNMGEEFGTEHEGYFKQQCCQNGKQSLNEYPNCPKFDAKRIFSDGNGYSCSLKGQEHLGKESCEKLKGKYTKDEKASCGEFAWYLKHMGEEFGEQHEGYFKSVCCTLPVPKICPESRPKFKAQSLFSEGTEWYCSIPGKHELAKPACEQQEGVWIKAEKTSCTDLKTWLHVQGDKGKMYRVDFIAKCCESEKDKVTQKPKPTLKPKPKPATEPQKCQKCSGHTCDYWAEKENYSCKSLKNHYGCDCGGCECKLDKEVDQCKADKCHGRTCVDWAMNSKVSCSILKDLFGCTCKGCKCPKEEDGKKKCSDPHLKGDGYCDDENNVESCDYDGGDCCHTPGKDNPQQFIYCDACECVDPNGKKSPRKCRLPKYQGDDHCDDGNNKESCDWDGGDCCGPTVNTKYCTDCLCVDPEYKGSRCIAKHMGDGFCDDANNNIKCSWDEGNCCNAHHVGQFRYCADCLCLDPTVHKESSSCSGKCGSDDHKGDQFCDDDNNNCAVAGTAVTAVAIMATCTNINTASNARVWILTSRHQNAQSKNSRVMVSATMKTTLQLVILMATTAVVPANTGPAITRINTNFARNASVWNHELLKLNFSARFLHRIMLMTLFFRMCNLLVSLVSHHTFIM